MSVKRFVELFLKLISKVTSPVPPKILMGENFILMGENFFGKYSHG
jgi:hypothetical protein